MFKVWIVLCLILGVPWCQACISTHGFKEIIRLKNTNKKLKQSLDDPVTLSPEAEYTFQSLDRSGAEFQQAGNDFGITDEPTSPVATTTTPSSSSTSTTTAVATTTHAFDNP